MSANPPLPADGKVARAAIRARWPIGAAVLVAVVAVAAIVVFAARSHSSKPAAAGYTSFAPGERPAPNFTLADEHGKALTLASLRGRPVIVTFIDPFCRDFCPREATVLTAAATRISAPRPIIVSVSVNPWGDTTENFAADKVHWKLGPEWRWGIGTYAQLAAVWKQYDVGVTVTKRTIAGVTIRKIGHTGAAYLIDANGDERALFLYPFTTGDVVGAARHLLGS